MLRICLLMIWSILLFRQWCNSAQIKLLMIVCFGIELPVSGHILRLLTLAISSVVLLRIGGRNPYLMPSIRALIFAFLCSSIVSVWDLSSDLLHLWNIIKHYYYLPFYKETNFKINHFIQNFIQKITKLPKCVNQ